MKKAYTLIEVLLTFALLSFVFAFTIPFAITEVSQVRVETVADDVRSRLFTTQINGFSGTNAQPHGISFGLNSYTVYEGTSLATAVSQETFQLENSIQFQNILLDDGSSEITTLPNSIIPSTFGTVELTDGTSVSRIIITTEGRSYVERI